MALGVLCLNRGGDGFRWIDEVTTAGDGKLSVCDRDLKELALMCHTHAQVLAFLALSGEELKDGACRIRLSHDNHPEYLKHSDKGDYHRCSVPMMRAFVKQRIVDTNPNVKKGDRLKTVIFSNSLPEMRKLFERASVRVNFWGRREVEFFDYDGTLSLKCVVERIYAIALQKSNEGIEPMADRVAGYAIAQCIQKIYTRSDAQVKAANLFTRMLVWLREFSFFSKTPRARIEDGEVRSNFGSYREHYEDGRSSRGRYTDSYFDEQLAQEGPSLP